MRLDFRRKGPSQSQIREATAAEHLPPSVRSMINGGRQAIVVGAAVVALMAAGGCGRDQGEGSPAERAAEYAKGLQAKVTLDGTMAHLQKLQEIADANGGTRVAGSPGYDASVEYVANTLRDKGFDVDTPEFAMALFSVGKESLSLNGQPVEAHVIDFSGPSPAEGAAGRFVVVSGDGHLGCAARDYNGVDVAGAVVLVDRGDCLLADKATAATERGAIALVVANDIEEKVFSGGMEESDEIEIPVLSVTKADGARLRSETGTATVIAEASVEQVTTRNVIAQTKTGATDNIAWSAHTSTASKRARASTTTGLAWRRCWRRRCRWVRHLRWLTRCGSGSGEGRRRVCSGRSTTSSRWTSKH